MREQRLGRIPGDAAEGPQGGGCGGREGFTSCTEPKLSYAGYGTPGLVVVDQCSLLRSHTHAHAYSEKPATRPL